MIGPLARDNLRFGMDDAATQQASIPPTDPNGRKGSHAFLSEEDRSDILCILSPGSRAACQAVELVAKTTPQHILQNQGLFQTSFLQDNLPRDEEQTTKNDAQDEPMTVDTGENTSENTEANTRPILDIALRMSSRLLNPCVGFTFGRAPEKSDLLICTTEQQKWVSGAHFRIYMTSKGVLMCLDTSTNGTCVDGHYLKRESKSRQRSLHGDSSIEVMFSKSDSMRFFVSVPDREGVSGVYGRKLDAYIGFVEQYGRQKQEELHYKTKGIPIEVLPVSSVSDRLIMSLLTISRHLCYH